MEPAFFNIERLTLENASYRKVISTNAYSQLVLMSLEEEEQIPVETHPYTSQFIRVEQGLARVTIGGVSRIVNAGDAVLIPPNTPHQVENYSNLTLKLYTIYSPPQHAHDLNQKEPYL